MNEFSLFSSGIILVVTLNMVKSILTSFVQNLSTVSVRCSIASNIISKGFTFIDSRENDVNEVFFSVINDVEMECRY